MTGTTDSPARDERTWFPEDIAELERKLVDNEAARHRISRLFFRSLPLLVLSVVGFVYTGRSLKGTLWPLIPLVAVWASLLLASVTAVNLWATWRIRRIIESGLAEAHEYMNAHAGSVAR